MITYTDLYVHKFQTNDNIDSTQTLYKYTLVCKHGSGSLTKPEDKT